MEKDSGFKLKILSPEQTLFEGDVEVLTVTATHGQLTVLKNHAPLITELVAGDLQIQGENLPAEPISLQSGFMMVQDNLVTVLKSS